MVLPVRVVWPKENKLSHNCLFQELIKCVCLVVCPVSLLTLVFIDSYMPKCKETLLQVKQRLTREQKNRTERRLNELLDLRGKESDSDSEGSQGDSIDECSDTLSLVRRDLYLGLLCLLLVILLLAFWVSSTFLRR